MKGELWQRAKQIFLDAAEQPLEKRESFLSAACGDDDSLRAGVDALLEFEQQADQFLITEHDEGVTATLKASTDPDRFGEAPADALLPGQVGSVRLLQPIGRGGMGEVWLGRDELLDRKVAVKFLLTAKPTHDDPDFKSLLDGARTAAAVRHANLTAIHYAGIAADRPYLVLEYIDGPTLAQLLRSVGPLELSSALKIIEAVGQAVGELHERGIIHRDIKPSNVLLDREGRVFVTDFGLACQRRVREMGTPVAEIAGTPRYMAPEMFEQTVSVRSDVYALGIMTYEMLTGTVPFHGTFQEVHEQHLNSSLPVERLRERGYGDALIDVLERATHKSAMYRYKSAAQFLRALQDARLAAGATSAPQVDLAALVGRAGQTCDSDKKSTTRGSSYYEHLSSRANERRSAREQVETDSAAPLKPATAPQSVGPAPATTVETLQVDVPCVTCTYNLRGLPGERVCPECGKPIAASLHPRRLMFADRAWLARVDSGVRGASLGALAVILMVPLIGSAVITYILALRAREGLLETSVLASITLVALWSLTCFGILRSTGREPRSADTRFRIASRILAGLWPVLILGGLRLESYRQFRDWNLGTASILAVVILLCGLSAYLRFVSALAKRTPDAGAVRRARRLSNVLAALCVLISVSYFVLDLVLTASARAGDFVLPVAWLLALVALPIPAWLRLRELSRGFRSALAVCTPHDAIFDDGSSSQAASLGAAPILCVKCGYNLLGLEADSRCPECGTPLSSSARGDLLSAADPAWLRGIYRGQLVLYLGCVALAAIPCLMVMGVMLISATSPSFLLALPLDTFFDAARHVLPLGGAAAVLIGIVGVTSLDPPLSLTEQPIALRRLTRGVAAGALAALATAKLLPSSISSLGTIAGVSKSALGWTGVVLLALTAVCFSYYLAHLAERIPDAPLADKTRLTAKRFVAFMAVFLGAELIAALAGFDGLSAIGRSQSDPWKLFMLAGMLSAFCAVFGVLRMMVRWRTFQKALKRCMLDARQAS